MHHVLARLVCKPEAVEPFAALLTDLVAKSKQEPGCVSYALYQRQDAPHVFQTVEAWKSAADADAHMGTPHVGAAVAAAGALFAQPPEIVAWNKLA